MSLREFQDYGLPHPAASNVGQVQQNINYLYDKLKLITNRNISFWDLYKISTSISDINSFKSVTTNLMPYTSAVINTQGHFQIGEDVYSTGDLVVKHQDGSIEQIKAQRGGIFFPQKITKDSANNYSIEYVLKTTEPQMVSASTDITASSSGVWDATQKYVSSIRFKNLTGDVAGSPYNRVYTSPFGNMTFMTATITDTETSIRPIVKGFNDSGEEIYWDLDCTLTNSNWTITNPNISILTTIVVK